MQRVWEIAVFTNLSKKEIFSRIFFFGTFLIILLIGILCLINAINWINRPFAGFLVNKRLIVANTGLDWTGTQAGLKLPDKILEANGRVITSSTELDDVVKNTKVGNPIRYSIEKDGQAVEMSIPTMRFALFDLFINFMLPFIIGILYLLIGLIVFIMKPDTKVSWSFALTCFFLSIPHIINFDVMSTYWMFWIYFFATIFLPAALIHLGLTFPEQKKCIQRYPSLLLVSYILSLILFILMYLTFQKPEFPKMQRLLFIYMVLSAFFILFSIMHVYFKSTSIMSRQRAKVVLFGTACAFPLPALGFFFSFSGAFTGGLKILNDFLSIPLIIFPASIAYAIAKHNLFDADVYIKRAVGYGLMTAIVGLIYFSLQTVIRTVILRPLVGDYAEKVYPILFAILVVFLFNPINRRVQGAVDKLFYRRKFDYKETVVSVSHALTSVLNLTEVIKRIINTVRKEMFIDTVGIILLDSQKKECQTLFIGDEANNIKSPDNECIKYGDPFVDVLSKNKRLITIYDITEDPCYRDIKHTCSERFSRMGVSMVLPLIYQGDVTGALALGYKKSGHFYTREDIDLLDTLASHGAVAIENAKLAEQMKKEETVRTNLARYLSPQIVDQVIKKDVQVNLGGDRKVVTVLFSDIRNFTRISETYRPDQLVQILNEYFTEMAKIIFENQGSLDKYIGDAIVAVFGSLILLDNSAKNAVQAAVQMMKRMPVLNEKWMKEYGFLMDIGIGINTGEVFLGNIGSPERMEFTVIGDTVNVASRFSGLAQPSQILITRETLNSLGNDVNHKELPAAAVKGKTEKLEVYEIPYS